MGWYGFFIRYKTGGWTSPIAYAFFAVMLLVFFGLLQLFIDPLVAVFCAMFLAGLAEYALFEIMPAEKEKAQESEQEAARKDAVRQVVQESRDCMSCMKPLEGELKCPNCGFDMAPIINKHDI